MNAYQEHLDHVAGEASEFQNCLTEAGQHLSARRTAEAQKIGAALQAGQFVVVSEAPVYCRATDALVGTCTGFVGAFAERLPAEIAAAHHAREHGDECYYYVLPRASLSKAPVEVEAAADDDCPF